MASKFDDADLTRSEPVPSLFDLIVPQRENKQYLMSLRGKIDREMRSSGFDTDAEWEAAYNFVAFLHWLMGEEEEAIKYTEKALIRNSENLIAHGNRIKMYQGKKLTRPAFEKDKLQVLVRKQKLLNRAKFEQAYAYSRFGPEFYKCSIDLFQEIINNDGTDLENMYLSKFGLALLLKRQFNVYNIFSFEHLSDFETSAKRAVDVLYDLSNNACSDMYRARGWVMLGEIVVMLHGQQNPHLNLDHILPTNIKDMQARKFFERGYSICSDDVYVLERFGKQARSWKDYKMSEMLLRKSIDIRRTSFAHHQLAITLRSVLNRSVSLSTRKAGKTKTEENSSEFFIPGRYKTFKFIYNPNSSTIIYNPKRVLPYQYEGTAAEILHHLDMSLECSPINSHAIFDKGLLFRSLGWYDKATELFVQAAKADSAPLHEVKCLEQQALCMIEIASTRARETCDTEEITSLYNKAIRIISQAIQRSAHIATSLPLPSKEKLPTIKKILLNETDKGRSHHDRMALEVLGNIYNIVGEYGQVLPFYKEISEMSDEDANDPIIIFGIAEKYAKQRDFYNSLILMDLIEASSTRLEGDHRRLYFEAYLDGVLNHLEMNGTDETVKFRFTRVAQFCSKREIENYPDVHEFEYDIHILSLEALMEESRIIHQVFADMCGLNVSCSSIETIYGILETNDATSSIIEHSCLIVFIFKEGDISDDFNSMALNLFLQKRLKSGIISICLGQTKVPTELQQFPVLQQPRELNIGKMSKDEKQQWIRLFFLTSYTFPNKSINM